MIALLYLRVFFGERLLEGFQAQLQLFIGRRSERGPKCMRLSCSSR